MRSMELPKQHNADTVDLSILQTMDVTVDEIFVRAFAFQKFRARRICHLMIRKRYDAGESILRDALATQSRPRIFIPHFSPWKSTCGGITVTTVHVFVASRLVIPSITCVQSSRHIYDGLS